MKSKVKFDLNEENIPVIVAEFNHSDDLRDKVALRFKSRLEYSPFLYGYFKTISSLNEQELHISTVGADLDSLRSLKTRVEDEMSNFVTPTKSNPIEIKVLLNGNIFTYEGKDFKADSNEIMIKVESLDVFMKSFERGQVRGIEISL